MHKKGKEDRCAIPVNRNLVWEVSDLTESDELGRTLHQLSRQSFIDKMRFTVTLIGLLCSAVVVHQSLGLFVHKCVRVGVDYGPRLIGLAYSDYFGKVYPHATIRNTGNLTKISEDIAKYALSLRAREVILGIPLDGSSDGQVRRRVKNMNGKICLNFSFVLACIVKSMCPDIVKVRLCDESYSTQEAKVKQAFGEEKSTVLFSSLCMSAT